ncbi:MAG: UDP-3-O-acyl-N-acetylglucosamine deacetylase, partial [Bacteroidota bacterium]
MENKQHTISKAITLSGKGLHTGAKVNITFKPAPPNHGYKFKRIDLPNAPIIHADVDNVVGTQRGTTIAENGAEMHTVEHTLA